MPKIAWLFEYPLLGGGDRSLLAALSGLRSAGYQPTAIAPAFGELTDELTRRQVPQAAIAWHAADGSRLSQAEARQQLKRFLEQMRPDLLHANSLAMARLAGPVAADLHLPSIAHLRDIVGLSAAAVADLNQNTRLLAVSHATRAFHLAQGVAGDKTYVLYNGVDLEQFAPASHNSTSRAELLAELRLPPTARLVGCIGQIIQRKGQDLLVSLARRLASLPETHLLIVGDRPSQKEEAVRFEESVRNDLTAAAPARVHFLDRRGDVVRLLPVLDLLVHPARQEPLGRVLLEAAACGLPIVATRVGGTEEIFPAPSAAAVLVDPQDGQALAEYADRLLADAPLRRQLGTAARRRAEEAFDARLAAARLAEHYAAALSARPAT